MTFAIAARIEDGWAAAAATYPMNVGHTVLVPRPGVGVALTMDYASVSLGERCLDAMATGANEREVLTTIVRAEPNWKRCHVSLVGLTSAAFDIGPGAIRYASSVASDDLVASANTMRNPGVPEAMVGSWRDSADEPVRHRLLSALEAGRDVGGDLRGHNSAALVVVPSDLRVEVHVADVNQSFGDPIAELADVALVPIAKRQMPVTKYDHGTAAWFAFLSGEHEQARRMAEQFDDELRVAYRGAVDYLEAAIACRCKQSNAGKLVRRLEEEHPEWIELARRGGEFADDLGPYIDGASS